MNERIQSHHLSKSAYVYLRQSTMGQVHLHTESTHRQYALQYKAQKMGWLPTNIKILDGDLGISGTQSTNREDFKTLVADVSMGKVGAVFALEASRLSRSCTDWHRLLELCALTGTLIIDEDGCYNPADFNDQLLLGLKGTMSQAELHFIRARLQGGKKNKAKKGELRFRLPIGFYYDEENQINFDADEQVRDIINLLFKVFKEMGSAYGVVHHFIENKLQFPKRAWGGIWNGKLIWSTLSHARVLSVLKNPFYAGVYFYGRFVPQKKLSSTGEVITSRVRLPLGSWEVMIHDHHKGYILWEEYLENQNTLKQNRTNRGANMLPTAAREGLALLQGLLICSCCGRRLFVIYKGNGGHIYPIYGCNRRSRDGIEHKPCFSIRGILLDQAISKRILEVIMPEQIKIAMKAFEEVDQRNKSLEHQWQMKIERANYEAQLAQRRYEEVDPSNRLVSLTVETRWNEKLMALEDIQAEYANYKKENPTLATQQEKDKVIALAKDFSRLWNEPSTKSKDRKRILRLLIKDITVEKLSSLKKVILHIRWQGGAVEDLELNLLEKIYDKWRYPYALIDKIRWYAMTMTDKQIADKLNIEGIKTHKQKPYDSGSIKRIKHKYHIPSPYQVKEGELSISQAAQTFNVGQHVVRYWVKRKIVDVWRIGTRIRIFVDSKKEAELRKLAENSKKIAIANHKSQNETTGGAV